MTAPRPKSRPSESTNWANWAQKYPGRGGGPLRVGCNVLRSRVSQPPRVFLFFRNLVRRGCRLFWARPNMRKKTRPGAKIRRQIRISKESSKIHAAKIRQQPRCTAPDCDSIISPRWPPQFWGMGRGSRGSSHMTTMPPTPTNPNTKHGKNTENTSSNIQSPPSLRKLRGPRFLPGPLCCFR